MRIKSSNNEWLSFTTKGETFEYMDMPSHEMVDGHIVQKVELQKRNHIAFSARFGLIPDVLNLFLESAIGSSQLVEGKRVFSLGDIGYPSIAIKNHFYSSVQKCYVDILEMVFEHGGSPEVHFTMSGFVREDEGGIYNPLLTSIPRGDGKLIVDGQVVDYSSVNIKIKNNYATIFVADDTQIMQTLVVQQGTYEKVLLSTLMVVEVFDAQNLLYNVDNAHETFIGEAQHTMSFEYEANGYTFSFKSGRVLSSFRPGKVELVLLAPLDDSPFVQIETSIE